jgi:biopolymer transport protein ExbD
MRTAFHAHGTDAAAHGIDLAPMLDFVVNLLIFFIITAVFVKQAGVEVSRPNASDDTTGEPARTLVIDARGELSIDGKPVDVRAVRAHVEQWRAVDPAAGVVVLAAEHAPTGALVAVIDEIHLGGIEDITFSTAL